MPPDAPLWESHLLPRRKTCTSRIAHEGIVAKRRLGIYKDDGNAWLKVKNRSYSQAEGRHELLSLKK